MSAECAVVGGERPAGAEAKRALPSEHGEAGGPGSITPHKRLRPDAAEQSGARTVRVADASSADASETPAAGAARGQLAPAVVIALSDDEDDARAGSCDVNAPNAAGAAPSKAKPKLSAAEKAAERERKLAEKRRREEEKEAEKHKKAAERRQKEEAKEAARRQKEAEREAKEAAKAAEQQKKEEERLAKEAAKEAARLQREEERREKEAAREAARLAEQQKREEERLQKEAARRAAEEEKERQKRAREEELEKSKKRQSITNWFTQPKPAPPQAETPTAAARGGAGCAQQRTPTGASGGAPAAAEELAGPLRAIKLRRGELRPFSLEPFTVLAPPLPAAARAARVGPAADASTATAPAASLDAVRAAARRARAADRARARAVREREASWQTARMKLCQFHEDVRPPRFGTAHAKRPAAVSARTPLARDTSGVLDYEHDSEAEWELEPEGEDLNSADELDDADELGSASDEEEGWLVDDDGDAGAPAAAEAGGAASADTTTVDLTDGAGDAGGPSDAATPHARAPKAKARRAPKPPPMIVLTHFGTGARAGDAAPSDAPPAALGGFRVRILRHAADGGSEQALLGTPGGIGESALVPPPAPPAPSDGGGTQALAADGAPAAAAACPASASPGASDAPPAAGRAPAQITDEYTPELLLLVHQSTAGLAALVGALRAAHPHLSKLSTERKILACCEERSGREPWRARPHLLEAHAQEMARLAARTQPEHASAPAPITGPLVVKRAPKGPKPSASTSAGARPGGIARAAAFFTSPPTPPGGSPAAAAAAAAAVSASEDAQPAAPEAPPAAALAAGASAPVAAAAEQPPHVGYSPAPRAAAAAPASAAAPTPCGSALPTEESESAPAAAAVAHAAGPRAAAAEHSAAPSQVTPGAARPPKVPPSAKRPRANPASSAAGAVTNPFELAKRAVSARTGAPSPAQTSSVVDLTDGPRTPSARMPAAPDAAVDEAERGGAAGEAAAEERQLSPGIAHVAAHAPAVCSAAEDAAQPRLQRAAAPSTETPLAGAPASSAAPAAARSPRRAPPVIMSGGAAEDSAQVDAAGGAVPTAPGGGSPEPEVGQREDDKENSGPAGEEPHPLGAHTMLGARSDSLEVPLTDPLTPRSPSVAPRSWHQLASALVGSAGSLCAPEAYETIAPVLDERFSPKPPADMPQQVLVHLIRAIGAPADHVHAGLRASALKAVGRTCITLQELASAGGARGADPDAGADGLPPIEVRALLGNADLCAVLGEGLLESAHDERVKSAAWMCLLCFAELVHAVGDDASICSPARELVSGLVQQQRWSALLLRDVRAEPYAVATLRELLRHAERAPAAAPSSRVLADGVIECIDAIHRANGGTGKALAKYCLLAVAAALQCEGVSEVLRGCAAGSPGASRIADIADMCSAKFAMCAGVVDAVAELRAALAATSRPVSTAG